MAANTTAKKQRTLYPDDIWADAFDKEFGAGSGKARIYKMKADAQRACQATQRRVFAFDLPPKPGTRGAPKRYVVATRDEFERAHRCVLAANRHAYELIPADSLCWLYFDLEYYRGGGLNAGLDGDALVARVADAGVAELEAAAAAQRSDVSLHVEVVVLASERPDKFSRHLIVKSYWTGGKLGCSRIAAPLEGSSAAGEVAARVSAALGPAGVVEAEGHKPTAFVDSAVYRKDALFRLAGCTKLGDEPAAAFAVVGGGADELRETLVCPETGAGQKVLVLGPAALPAPVPAAATPAPAAAAPAPAAAAPAPPSATPRVSMAGAGLAGATNRPLLDSTTALSTIGPRRKDKGRPPEPFKALYNAAVAAFRASHPSVASFNPRDVQWEYKATQDRHERYLLITFIGRFYCFSKGRAHKSHNIIVAADVRTGAMWQKCWDRADCCHMVETNTGDFVCLLRRHALATAPYASLPSIEELRAFEQECDRRRPYGPRN